MTTNTETEKTSPPLSDAANKILEDRYYRDGETTPEDLFTRVSDCVSGAERSPEQQARYADEFFWLMRSLRFLPNSPTLVNAGVEDGGCLSACFVTSPEDSMASIMQVASDAAMIEKWGGGVGFGLSNLRPKGDRIKTTHGEACGPISVMELYSAVGATLTQGAFRLGAHMGQLRVTHPDVQEFIHCKDGGKKLTNFNISVQITDDFMEAVKRDEDWTFTNPRDGSDAGTVRARDLWHEIAESAWKTGDPGVVFIDRVWDTAPNPQMGRIESSNPCGEENLENYGNCCLGSINLDRHVVFDSKGDPAVDWELLDETTKLAVRFLDDVIDVNVFPLPKLREVNLATRRIGLGVMGFADMLVRLGVPYDSPEALRLAEETGGRIKRVALETSEELASERGAFPEWEESALNDGTNSPVRHSSVTTIAPTGTISRLAGCSSGIEPHFALAWRSNVLWKSQEEASLSTVDAPNSVRESVVGAVGAEKAKEVLGRIADSPESAAEILRESGASDPDALSSSMSISPTDHVKMQAAWQKNVTNAVSKTVNLPNEATVDDVRRVYEEAHELGCKSVTVYRDGSRDAQVLNVGVGGEKDGEEAEETAAAVVVRKRPRVMHGRTERVKTAHGNAYITVNPNGDGKPFEVFAILGKAGGCDSANIEAVSRLASLALRAGVDADEVIDNLRGITCCPAWDEGTLVRSAPDAMALALERSMEGEESESLEAVRPSLFDAPPKSSVKVSTATERGCPKCRGKMVMREGCMSCLDCGYSKCD